MPHEDRPNERLFHETQDLCARCDLRSSPFASRPRPPRRSRKSRIAARSSAASARACRAFPILTTRATGPASTSISAARSRRRCFNDAEQGQVHAALGQGPVRAAQVRRHRPAVAQHHLDLSRDVLVRELRRRHLLRRPGLHGAQGAQGQFGARAQRRLGLHPDRHHHRAQPRRLFPRQQHEVRGHRVRHRRRDRQGLRVRPLRRVHHRRLAALCREAQAHQRQRSRHPAGDHLQGAARPAGAPRRRSMVRRRQVDALSRCSTPRSSASPPRTSTRR